MATKAIKAAVAGAAGEGAGVQAALFPGLEAAATKGESGGAPLTGAALVCLAALRELCDDDTRFAALFGGPGIGLV